MLLYERSILADSQCFLGAFVMVRAGAAREVDRSTPRFAHKVGATPLSFDLMFDSRDVASSSRRNNSISNWQAS